MSGAPQRGLPPRVYVPIVAAIAAIFLALVGWLLHTGFSTGGSVFGSGTGAAARGALPSAGLAGVNVEGGGPPPAVQLQLQDLRKRVARNPRDDVALTQLGDMYLAAGKYAQAIPYYRRALKVNPRNVAASEGLTQARASLQSGE